VVVVEHHNLVFLSNELYSYRYNILTLLEDRVLDAVRTLGRHISDFRKDIQILLSLAVKWVAVFLDHILRHFEFAVLPVALVER
jgi:hypothetical protein